MQKKESAVRGGNKVIGRNETVLLDCQWEMQYNSSSNFFVF